MTVEFGARQTANDRARLIASLSPEAAEVVLDILVSTVGGVPFDGRIPEGKGRPPTAHVRARAGAGP